MWKRKPKRWIERIPIKIKSEESQSFEAELFACCIEDMLKLIMETGNLPGSDIYRNK
jgi:hypothetical protein